MGHCSPPLLLLRLENEDVSHPVYEGGGEDLGAVEAQEGDPDMPSGHEESHQAV